jgi:23S rRNA (guanine745-N1)-methyltransferase
MISLSCPVCGEAMVRLEKSYRCSNAHSFDLSKEGYCNFVLNNKHSSGDSKDMMISRRNFLANGYYQSLSDTVNRIVDEIFWNSKEAKNFSLVDVGSGEGYYLRNVKEYISSKTDFQAEYYGIDLSKTGIKMAAKIDSGMPSIHWIVSNFVKLPFMDKSISVILSMFSNYNLDEFARILSPSGHVIIIRPTEQHLIELKNVVYPKLIDKVKAMPKYEGFSAEKSILEYKTLVSGTENLMNLLKMTPHYWKVQKTAIDRLLLLKSLQVTVSVEITILTKE